MITADFASFAGNAILFFLLVRMIQIWLTGTTFASALAFLFR